MQLVLLTVIAIITKCIVFASNPYVYIHSHKQLGWLEGNYSPAAHELQGGKIVDAVNLQYYCIANMQESGGKEDTVKVLNKCHLIIMSGLT